MTRTLLLAVAASALVAGGLAAAGEEGGAPAPGPGLVTLHAGDPLTHTLNLVDGSFGARIAGTEFRETRAHLDYGVYGDDALTVALEEDDRGLILDLGHWADLARAYRIEEADGGGVAFASISVDGSRPLIARRHPGETFQTLLEARPLLSSARGERRAALHPVAGHVYLVRIEHHRRDSPPVHAKILVVSHVPGDRVTLRWDRIPGL